MLGRVCLGFQIFQGVHLGGGGVGLQGPDCSRLRPGVPVMLANQDVGRSDGFLTGFLTRCFILFCIFLCFLRSLLGA